MEVPGHLGYSIFGDKSLEFVRSPREYIKHQRKIHGDVFKGRILSKPHVFLTSNMAVDDFLNNKSSHFNMAYKTYLRDLFCEPLLFLEGEKWLEARELLETTFTKQSVLRTLEQTKSVIQRYISKIEIGTPLQVYDFFKEVSTRLSIALFLGQDIGEEAAKEISALMTTHWRGIISVPLPISIPWTSWRSGYGRALEAKDQLMKIIQEKLSDNSASNMASEVKGALTDDHQLAAQHLLLFVSALIPKAMASLLTSAIIELSKPDNLSWQPKVEEEEAADHVLLEVERLWPPFFGGARVCSESCEVAGFKITEGTQVSYISHSANRDGKVFPQPDTFYPERWTRENVGDRDRVWTFGGGVRKCIGKFLSNSLLKECLQELSRRYRWELVPGQDLDYKTLPVSRPKNDIQAVFNLSH